MLNDDVDTCLCLPKERIGVILLNIGVVGEELSEAFVGGFVVVVDVVEEFLCSFKSIYKGCLTHTIQIIYIK